MYRYRHRSSTRRSSATTTKRRSTARSNKNFGAGPIVAFLLIASFGILFAGCSKVAGPSQANEAQNDAFVFTEQDVERFRALAEKSADSSTQSVDGLSNSSLPVLNAGQSSAQGSAASLAPAVVDLSMMATYDALRTNPALTGANQYVVTNSVLNVRSQPSAGSSLVVSLKEGDMLTMDQFVNGEWGKVKTANGKTGFVALQYVSKLTTDERLVEDKKATENLYYVSYTFVNVRAEPNQGSAKLGEIPSKAFVKAVSVQGPWIKMQFEGKDGYVSTDFVTKFEPKYLVQQGAFRLPILIYTATEPDMLNKAVAHAKALKTMGVKLTTLRDFRTLLISMQQNSTAKLEKSAIIAFAGLTPTNVKEVSTALYSNGIPSTFFIETKNLGISGITDKTVATLNANGFDLQSAGHTGDDLRSLTTAQVKLEVEQSRKMLEDATKKPVFALLYPQGGVNERVLQKTKEAGYLFGVMSGTDSAPFRRDQMLQIPSVTVTADTTADTIKAFLP